MRGRKNKNKRRLSGLSWMIFIKKMHIYHKTYCNFYTKVSRNIGGVAEREQSGNKSSYLGGSSIAYDGKLVDDSSETSAVPENRRRRHKSAYQANELIKSCRILWYTSTRQHAQAVKQQNETAPIKKNVKTNNNHVSITIIFVFSL